MRDQSLCGKMPVGQHLVPVIVERPPVVLNTIRATLFILLQSAHRASSARRDNLPGAVKFNLSIFKLGVHSSQPEHGLRDDDRPSLD